MSLYLSCPYAHYLRYVKRLEKKRPERPLFFGSDFHTLLELRNNKEELKKAKQSIVDTFYGMPPSWQSDLGENYPQDILTIFKDYQRLYKDAPQPQVTEQEFDIKVGEYKGEPIEFVGKIDELYLKKRNGVKRIVVGEHKTFNQKPNMNTLVMNPQKCLYAKAVQFLKGILPDKVKWDYIKSSPSIYPIWLDKSKRFSEAASTKVTPMSWRRACREMGILDKEVIQRGEKYKGNISEFFFQAEMDIDPAMVDNTWEGFIFTAKQIIRFGEKNKTKNVTRDCSWCTFHDICYAEMTGGDAGYVIGRDFKERERKV